MRVVVSLLMLLEGRRKPAWTGATRTLTYLSHITWPTRTRGGRVGCVRAWAWAWAGRVVGGEWACLGGWAYGERAQRTGMSATTSMESEALAGLGTQWLYGAAGYLHTRARAVGMAWLARLGGGFCWKRGVWGGGEGSGVGLQGLVSWSSLAGLAGLWGVCPSGSAGWYLALGRGGQRASSHTHITPNTHTPHAHTHRRTQLIQFLGSI